MDLILLQGTLREAFVSSISKLLQMPLQALFAHLNLRIGILFDQVMQLRKAPWRHLSLKMPWRSEWFKATLLRVARDLASYAKM